MAWESWGQKLGHSGCSPGTCVYNRKAGQDLLSRSIIKAVYNLQDPFFPRCSFCLSVWGCQQHCRADWYTSLHLSLLLMIILGWCVLLGLHFFFLQMTDLITWWWPVFEISRDSGNCRGVVSSDKSGSAQPCAQCWSCLSQLFFVFDSQG